MTKKTILYLLTLLLFYILEYVLGFFLTKGFTNLLLKIEPKNYLLNFNISLILSKLLIFFLVLFLISKIKIKNLIRYSKIDYKLVIFSLVIGLGYFIINRYIFDANFKMNIKPDAYNSSLLYLSGAIVIGPIYEEVLYRGIGFEFLKSTGISDAVIIIFTSLVFGLIHLPDLDAVFGTFALGLICSICYLKTRNIIYPICIHAFYNFLMFNII